MDKIKLRAIVVKEIPVGEADKLLVLLAKGIGKITIKAKGARNIKNKTACGTSIFSYCDYIVLKTKNTYTMVQADVIENFYAITFDLDKLAYSAVALEIVEKVCRENEPDDEIMFLLLKILQKISNGVVLPRIALLVFYIKFMQYFGCMSDCICDCGLSPKYVAIDGFYCEECRKNNALKISETAINIIKHILNENMNNIFKFEINDNVVLELERVVKIIFDANVGIKIKSLDFIESLKKVNR